ncbi:MAG: biosynthetic peptidoglycan transglycosylase [Gemmatimonadales bacterium]
MLALAWLCGVWPPPVWWRDHEPRCTAMMRVRDDCPTPGRPDARTARDAQSSRAPQLLERMIIIAEDSRFRTHHGVDFVELREALAAGGRRGASTITQQLAKNLYLSPSRSLPRKVKEAVTAWRLELALSKHRIMALYLSTAEWGPGIWGAAAASEAYYGVPPARLTPAQAAALAATLPHPRSSNPAYQPARMTERRALILARYYGRDVVVPRAQEEEIEIPVIPPITIPRIPPVILDSIRVQTDSSPDTPRPDTARRTDATAGLSQEANGTTVF